jgi:hypothetical protein
MIGEAELRRAAARAGVDLMVLDLDYTLGWFLAGLFSQTEAAPRLIFKAIQMADSYRKYRSVATALPRC